MEATGVILVFRRAETMDRIRRVLVPRGYAVEGAFLSGGHALRFAGSRDVDVAVVNSDIQDVPLDTLCRELKERCGCEVVLLSQDGGDGVSLVEKSGLGVMCLPRPVTVELLLSAMETASRFRKRIKELDQEVRRYRETLERRAFSEKAKHVLMAARGMTEDVAWRYLQKTSMDTGRPMTEIAKEILALYGEG